MSARKVLVLFSGGLDSTVVLTKAYHEYTNRNIHAISLNYGQRHSIELERARMICKLFEVDHETIKIPTISSSILTDASAEIPDIGYKDIEGISPMYVPFRNGLMLATLASYAQAHAFDEIWYGAHAEDAHNWAYPDCTPEFNGAMANAIYIGTYEKVRLITPFQWHRKFEIVKEGFKLGAPLGTSWSCYKGGEYHCGTCATCRARKEAFKLAGVIDTTVYLDMIPDSRDLSKSNREVPEPGV